ncbi:hypothetical protein CLU79DRAFT_727352 [Phycomyces nitens]|nr:hypothetical protein CLU79DRAFT_727352 [Phycomyces nitens]
MFNGAILRSGACLQLSIYSFESNRPEPKPLAEILYVRNLPPQTNNRSLYDMFRPFGPMNICKVLVEQGHEFKGTALILYFKSEDAVHAEQTMSNTTIFGSTITVVPYVSKQRSQPVYEGHAASANKQRETTISQVLKSTTPPQSNLPAQVDFTNLYIKNLDLDVTSKDLCSNFCKYGHIVSARVMKDKNGETEKSKGFGFVSFLNPSEAQYAMREMNNKYILSKPIVVAFHEPKKKRTDRPSQPQNNFNSTPPLNSPIPNSSGTQTSYFQPLATSTFDNQQQPKAVDNRIPDSSRRISSRPSYAPALAHSNHSSTFPSTPDYIPAKFTSSQPDRSPQAQSQFTTNGFFNSYNNVTSGLTANYQQNLQTVSVEKTIASEYPNAIRKSQISMAHLPPAKSIGIPATPVGINTAQHSKHSFGQPIVMPKKLPNTPSLTTLSPPQFKPAFNGLTLRRRDSVESVSSAITVSTSSMQRIKMKNAVAQFGESRHVDDIVDLLLTLKIRERTLCLFNSDFLRDRIEQAKSALEVFSEEDEVVTPVEQEDRSYCHSVVPLYSHNPYQHQLAHHNQSQFQHQSHQQSTLCQPDKATKMIGRYTATSQWNQPSVYNVPLLYPPKPLIFSGEFPTTINTTLLGDLSLQPRGSRAIPIVAPSAKQPSSTDPRDTSDSEEQKVTSLLNSIQGMSGIVKKQLVGDNLFPLVKAIGVRQAPKITIRLLDTFSAEELCHLMYDEKKLKAKVDGVIASFNTQ